MTTTSSVTRGSSSSQAGCNFSFHGKKVPRRMIRVLESLSNQPNHTANRRSITKMVFDGKKNRCREVIKEAEKRGYVRIIATQ